MTIKSSVPRFRSIRIKYAVILGAKPGATFTLRAGHSLVAAARQKVHRNALAAARVQA
jgi:hypothetical protein